MDAPSSFGSAPWPANDSPHPGASAGQAHPNLHHQHHVIGACTVDLNGRTATRQCGHTTARTSGVPLLHTLAGQPPSSTRQVAMRLKCRQMCPSGATHRPLPPLRSVARHLPCPPAALVLRPSSTCTASCPAAFLRILYPHLSPAAAAVVQLSAAFCAFLLPLLSLQYVLVRAQVVVKLHSSARWRRNRMCITFRSTTVKAQNQARLRSASLRKVCCHLTPPSCCPSA